MKIFKSLVCDILFAAVYPFLLPSFLFRMMRRGGYAARMGDRFAVYPPSVAASLASPGRPFVWVHAVSVGEVQVAGRLMREMRRLDPSVRFCFSTTSSTGWKMAEREIAARDVLVYNPLDFPNFVKSAFAVIRPCAVILAESEIWPVMIRRAAAENVPVFLVNARMSDRSAPRYKAARWLLGDVFVSFAAVFAQSDMDARRFEAAGADPSKIRITGSFKFDAASRAEEKEREMAEWTGGGRILLGGSTWPGEDEMMLGIYSRLPGREGIKLVIAPRHFEKADAVEENIRRAGFECVRRSRGDKPVEGAVYLADATGELMGLYGIASAVFVGKSVTAHGSQNMIEPCAAGKPTVVGPNTENFRPVMSDLLAADAIVQAKDAAGVESAIRGWFENGDGGLGERAAKAVASRKGVVGKCAGEILGRMAK